VHTYKECFPCFFTQALKTLRLITDDEQKIWNILTAISKYLAEVEFGTSPPEISSGIYTIISRETGILDPYKDIKYSCTKQALDWYPELQDRIVQADDPLFTAVKLAVGGNIIDFGINSEFDLKKDIIDILSRDFTVNDYQEFRTALKQTGRILYLGDNAGETVFDRILIEQLGKPVTYVVREQPIINDAVRQDALEAGLGDVAEIISSGSHGPGTVPGLCDPEFLEILQSSDLIISKGQGNYEGLSASKLPIFFLLKAKCSVIARHLGVEQGSLILKSNKS